MQVQFENINLEVREEPTHGWILETALVAEGYQVEKQVIKKHLQRNASEFVEGKHFVRWVQNVPSNEPQIFFTKRGVVRLGFFIKSERAKKFRDWAEDLIINKTQLIEIPKTYGQLLLEAGRIAIENERLELKVDNLSTALDTLVEWVSIIKVSRFNRVHESKFNWRLLKRKNEEMGFLIKKSESPRFGFQNLYNVNAFKSCYPQFNYKFLDNDSQLTVR